jgi:flavorubredoxin
MNVFIAYDSKYGNTKLAAESVLEGIRENRTIEAAIGSVKETDPKSIAKYDAIVFGAPNHMGRPSKTMKKFVDDLARLEPKTKHVAVFGTYAGRTRAVDRALKKLERMVQEKLPNARLVLPGLSVRVNGVTGPVVEGELPKCVEFGKKIAGQLSE